jgi:hypothetical protein
VLVASYHSLHTFDRGLKFIRQTSNPLFANLHELSWDGDNIWATSTDIDAAIKVDRSGKAITSWWPREDPVVAERYHLTPLRLDKEKDNRTAFAGAGNTAPSHVHLNAVALWNDRPLVLLNRFGCVVRLYPTEIVIEDAQLQGCHNILVTVDGSILINNTIGRALHVYDADGLLQRRIDLVSFPPVRKILHRHTLASIGCWLGKHGRPARLFQPLFHKTTIARPLFVRGLCQTSRQSVLVGISPATILEIDWTAGKLRDMYMYSEDRHVCIHGIAREE